MMNDSPPKHINPVCLTFSFLHQSTGFILPPHVFSTLCLTQLEISISVGYGACSRSKKHKFQTESDVENLRSILLWSETVDSGVKLDVLNLQLLYLTHNLIKTTYTLTRLCTITKNIRPKPITYPFNSITTPKTSRNDPFF